MSRFSVGRELSRSTQGITDGQSDQGSNAPFHLYVLYCQHFWIVVLFSLHLLENGGYLDAVAVFLVNYAKDVEHVFLEAAEIVDISEYVLLAQVAI